MLLSERIGLRLEHFIMLCGMMQICTGCETQMAQLRSNRDEPTFWRRRVFFRPYLHAALRYHVMPIGPFVDEDTENDEEVKEQARPSHEAPNRGCFSCTTPCSLIFDAASVVRLEVLRLDVLHGRPR